MNFFEYAKPVWVKGLSTTKNVTCLFSAVLPKGKTGRLTITACSFYRVFIGGELFAYGPARAPKGFSRVDAYVLPKNTEDKVVLIEVAGYYCHSFYGIQQPSFVQAELFVGKREKIYATYARKDSVQSAEIRKFSCRKFKERVRKCPRYSFQRGFAECYRFEKNPKDIYAAGVFEKNAKLEEIEDYILLKRGVSYTVFEKVDAQMIEYGISKYNTELPVWEDRTFKQKGIGLGRR